MKNLRKIYNVLFKKSWNTGLKAHGGMPQTSCHNAGESPGLVFSFRILWHLLNSLYPLEPSSPSSQEAPWAAWGTQLVRAGTCVATCTCVRVRLCFCLEAQESSGSNQYKCNLRTCRASGEREKAWRELITGQEEEQDGESGALGARWALPRKDGVRLR